MAEKDSPPGVQKWLNHISAYDREFKKWEGRVEKILKRYRDEMRDGRRGYTEARYNILWANVQTLTAAVYSKTPQPDVSRRFRDNDPVGRVASLILERALDYEIQHYPDYRQTMRECVLDRFLGGRGTSWVRYEPHFRAMATGAPVDGEQVSEDVDEPQEELDYECAPTDYVHWKDFGHTVARTWEEVTAVWRRAYMTRQMLVERFGEEGEKVPLDTRPDEQKGKYSSDEGNENYRAVVYEIWCKETKKAYWLSKSLGKILDEKDDPLGLEEFFPCPRPLFATTTNDTLVPLPDYTLYQDQANELDILSDRIDGLIKALQVKGVYDGSQTELGRLFTEGENNTLLPVKNWMAFAEKQGLKGAIDLVDLTPIASALKEAYLAMEQVKQQIYDITGISDIVRGQTAANETATAQQIKGQYASLRLKTMQEQVAQFATQLLQLKAQVICKKFAPETILKISAAEQLSEVDRQMIPQALALLVGEERMMNPDVDGKNPLRSFRIEVNADSLVQLDEQAEKEARVEFLTATGGFLEKAAMVGAQVPELVPLIMEMLKFGVTGFKVGKTIEGQFDETAEKLKASVAQKAQQPPPPDPEVVKAQQQAQIDAQKMQQEGQIEQARMQQEQMMEAQRMQMEERMTLREQAQQQALEQQRMEAEQRNQMILAQMDAQFQQFKALLEARTKVEVAQIGAVSAEKPEEEKKEEGTDSNKVLAAAMNGFAEVVSKLNAPKRVIRDKSGRVSGVE